MPGFVFICGVPRSGTTLFAELLNLHPQVVVGVERFKFVVRRETNAQFNPSLFDKQRFFDVRPEDTNLRWTYDQEKYERASWLGDKVPHYYRHLPTIFDRFPAAQVFYLFREAEAVARSWNDRARKATDSWPERNDYRRAVNDWNRANRIALRNLRERPDQFHAIAYEDLCSGKPDTIAAALGELGLAPTPEIEALSLTTSTRHDPMAEDERLYVEGLANLDIYRRLQRRKLAGTKP